MAFKKVIQFADVTPVSNGALATVEVPKSGVIHEHDFRLLNSSGAEISVANAEADIDNVRVSLDGFDIIDATPEVLYSLHSFYNGALNSGEPAGLLPISYNRPHLANSVEAEVFSLGMEDVGSFIVEFDLASSVSNLAQIEQRVMRSDVKRPLGTHVRLNKFPRSFSSTGTQEVTDIPLEKDAGVLAFHIAFDGSGVTPTTLDEVEVIQNSQTVRKLSPIDAQVMAEKAGREWQVGGAADDLFSIIFDETNDLRGFLPHAGTTDLRLKLTWGGAAPNTYTIYRESVHNLSFGNK